MKAAGMHDIILLVTTMIQQINNSNPAHMMMPHYLRHTCICCSLKDIRYATPLTPLTFFIFGGLDGLL